jgi:nitroreductase
LEEGATMYDHDTIKKAIIKSQHCQRNWDLSKKIPEEDIELLKLAATQCPSKQNVAHYKVHFITNRNLIETIHGHTNGFTVERQSDGTLLPRTRTSKDQELEYITNSQTMANLLVILEDYTNLDLFGDRIRNAETFAVTNDKSNSVALKVQAMDRNIAVGIAAGYLNFTANLLGYRTGCCTCLSHEKIKEAAGLGGLPILLMGIGFKDDTRNRREHHVLTNFVYPTKEKQEIPFKLHE